jgi:signal transduction histidine kinase
MQCQTACRPGQLRYNPINDWIGESCIDTGIAAPTWMNLHIRPTVAKWLQDLSLGTRLSFLIGLIVFGVVTSVSYLEVRSYEDHIDSDLVDTARLAARSAADQLAEWPLPLDPLDIRDSLHDLIEADPVVDSISVIEAGETGHPRVFTSTSTEERAEILDLAGRAIAANALTSLRNSTLVMFALPVPRREHYAVAVTVGLESLAQARTHEFRVALGFAAPTIVLVTILVHLTVRRLVGRPLNAILGVMNATAEGDLRARTTMTRRDELGLIAGGLNEMLDQLERFNRSLQNELFALRESLAHAERMAALGQVAANVAHEAGTPLNLVSGYVQMMRDDPETDERARSRLRTVDAQIQQVTRVLRTMLDHARRPAAFTLLAVADIIERVREVAQPQLSRSHIRLDVSVDEDLPAVRADATQLEMALLNLVTNALDAMPGGGTLSIAARGRPGGVRVEVADTGYGIRPEVIDRLFDSWVTTKPAGQGTGLGLAIVRDVVRAHGGSISASNQSTGALFVIDLPSAGSARRPS